MPSSTPFQPTTPGGINRRAVIKAAAWATPALVLATAVPAAAASIIPDAKSNFWVDAVRPAASITAVDAQRPGFRFGHAVSAGSGAATLTFTTAGADTGKLVFTDIFTKFQSETWTRATPVHNQNGTYTYTFSSGFTSGPAAAGASTPPANTVGVTVKLRGVYTAGYDVARAALSVS